MNRGLVLRAIRELWPTTLVLGLVLLGVEAALGFVVPRFSAQFSKEWLQIDFARGIVQAMLGTELGERPAAHIFQAIAWAHPLVLSLVVAHAMISCTRVPAGEVDRGTADVILGLPVSRWEIFFSETAVWLAGGVVLLAAALAGNTLGSLGLPRDQRPEIARVLIVLVNLFAFYVASGGLAWLVSSLNDRRGRAMTIVFLIMLSLFLLDYLAQFWHPLQSFVFLSPLHYHRPANAFLNATWPARDLAVLFVVGLFLSLAGGAVFSRRDLCTV